MIYDKSGNVISAVYNKSGVRVNPVYDVNGNAITIADEITVMTYNYQWCMGLNNATYQQEIYSTYNPDIIGIQEASRTGTWPSTALSTLGGYDYKYLSDYYNYNGIASKIELSDVTDNCYSTPAAETFSYQKCYFYKGWKKIAWYNTHLAFELSDTAKRTAQAHMLFEDAETEDYVIITGDFNMAGLAFDSAEYIGIGKPFADAGYNLANWTSNSGFVKTWTDAKTAQSLDDFTYSTDNIIVSSNIDIDTVVFDEIKLLYADGTNTLDHVPIVAKLIIN